MCVCVPALVARATVVSGHYDKQVRFWDLRLVE